MNAVTVSKNSQKEHTGIVISKCIEKFSVRRDRSRMSKMVV